MKVFILGAYQTKFGELWDKSLADITAEAVLGVVDDAGINKTQIQAAFFANKMAPEMTGQNHLGAMLAEILALNIPVTRIEAACASGGAAIHQACLTIASGQYEAVLVVGAEKMTDLGVGQVAAGLMGAASQEERQAGLNFVGLYALMAQTYFQKYGASEKDLACVAVKNHFHASLNPKAQFPFPITIQHVLDSAMVADPLKLLDCSAISDGAAAVILASEKIARKINRKKPRIIASRQSAETLDLAKREIISGIKSSQSAASQALKEASIEAKEIDLAEVHDCFTIAEILALEDLGFYKKGEGYLAVRNGEIKLGGKRPINLSGGLKACGHPVGATGIKQIVEVYNQLTGRAGKRQANRAKLALTHNVGGTGGTAVVHVIKK